MSVGTLFYICGSVLAASAVVTTFIGLKVKEFPGKAAPIVALWFITLIACTATFGVLHSQDEEQARASELVPAGEEVEAAEAESLQTEEEGTAEEGGAGKQEAAEAQQPAPEQAGGAGGSKPGGGVATTLQLAADPTEIAFDKTSLTANAGKVTIDFTNPAPLEHDVAIDKGGKTLAKSETIASGKTSVSVVLKPGSYTFLCTVPGHAEAGMEGTLTVK
jgi:plastocyanin